MSWFGRGELERRVDSLERRAGVEPRSAQDPRVAAPRLWSDNFGALATRSLQLIVVIVLVAGIIWGLRTLSTVFSVCSLMRQRLA